VHRHQKDQEISGGATVEAEQQHVALSSLEKNKPTGLRLSVTPSAPASHTISAVIARSAATKQSRSDYSPSIEIASLRSQ
jgi:hypothetical protein